jgi:lipoprotein NlpD
MLDSYRVKSGDTLYSIARETGHSPQDIASWNNVSNPDQISVGRLLRVAPPSSGASAAARPAPTHEADSAQTEAFDPIAAIAAGRAGNGAGKPRTNLFRPARGPILSHFDGKTRRGIDIGGKVGDPVNAVDNGKVIYVGDMPGYKTLIVIKHKDASITAYSNNSRVLTREGSVVKKGQQIAEMAGTDPAHGRLHFEMRRDGRLVDPALYLPPQ